MSSASVSAATVSAFDGARIDGSLFVEVTDLAERTRWLNTLVVWSTDAGLLVFAVLVLMAWMRARRRDSSVMGAVVLVPIAVVVSFAVAEIVKQVAAEPRPCRALPHAYILETCPAPTDFAFPSGHTTVTVAVAVALWFTSRRLGAVAAVFAVLEAGTRVYVGGHYPHDVVAAAVLSAAVAYLLSRALHRRSTIVVTRLRRGHLAPLLAATDPAREATGPRVARSR